MKMKRKTSHVKALSVILSVLMLLSALPVSVFAAPELNAGTLPEDTYLISKTDYRVAPGIDETQFILNNEDGDRQNLGYALTVELGGTASLIASYKDQNPTSYGLQTVRDQAAAAEQKRGVNVVAGVNGDIFNMQTGATSGTLVMDGVVYTHHSGSTPTNGRPYFAIMKDGSAEIREADEPLDDVKEALGLWAICVQDGVNISTPGGNYDSSEQPRTAVGIKADGSVVLFVNDGRQAPLSAGMSWTEVADVMISLGCVVAGHLDGGGSTTYVSQHEGEDGLSLRSNPSDQTERTVSTALLVTSSARPSGVFDHANLTPNNEVYTPYSKIQFTATGVDSAGAAVDLPADGVFDLADDSFGTITEDGLFTSNDKTGTVFVNYLSGGEVCGSVTIEIQHPDELYVPSDEVSLGFEQTTDFGIVAKYQDRDVHLKPGDLLWALTDDEGNDVSTTAGTFDGLTFTTFDGVTVNANCVATYAYNAAVTANIRAIIGAMPQVIYDFEYTTDAEEAAISEDLDYIASYDLPVYDRSWEGTYAEFGQQCYEEGYPFFTWPTTALQDDQAMTASIVSREDGEPVRFGDHALRIDYNYESTVGGKNINCYLRVAEPSFQFERTPTAFGCWVYVPEGTANFILALECSNKDGNSTYTWVPDDNGMTWTGWRYVEMSLTDENIAVSGGGSANAPYGITQGRGILWISYWQAGPKGDLTANHIYVDNFQVIYGANTADIDNPEVTSIRTDAGEIVDGETVLESNINTFRASYSDFDGKYATGIDFDTVKMYIDGIDVTEQCYINEGDEEIYFYDMELSNGEHRIEISLEDNFGNAVSQARSFTVSGESDKSVVALTALDDVGILGETYTMTVTSDDIDNVASLDMELKLLTNFPAYWSDFTVEPGKDFVLDGEASYNSLTTTLSFKLNRITESDPEVPPEIATEPATEPIAASDPTPALRSVTADDADDDDADDNVIAKIIVHVPTNIPEGLGATYRVDKGELTFVNPVEGTTYVSGFSGSVETLPLSPLILTTDIMLVGAEGGYIYLTDLEGQPVAGANIYTETDNILVGTTDEEGKLWTSQFTASLAAYSIYADLDGTLSFVYDSQSYNCGGTADGMPTFVKLNASTDPATMQSISWMSSPLASADTAVVLYATKADYETNGAEALESFTGYSVVSEMNGTDLVTTNYAVRLNNALLTDLEPETEYVYFVGDGEIMTTEPKTFVTSDGNQNTNFFVIGDTQATDTTNTSIITSLLAQSGIDYSFGIQTGDAADTGDSYMVWADIAEVFSNDFLGSQDMIHVLGNHEYYGDITGANAATYFNLPGATEDAAPLCYSVEYGNVYVAAINYSNVSGYREAAEWLIEDAAASDATWKVLTMHQPAYFTNPGGGSEALQDIIASAVDEAGIDFVFSGHDHSYARTMPLTDGEVDEVNGAVYFICGSTGEKSYEIVNNPEHHYAEFSDSYNATYLSVSATDTAFAVTVYDVLADGTANILDTYTMTKSITCTEEGTHAYEYDNGDVICSVCGYHVEAYSGFLTDRNNGKKIYLQLGRPLSNVWHAEGSDTYYLDENSYVVTGEVEITEAITPVRDEAELSGAAPFDGAPITLTYTFDEDGKLIRGADLYMNGARYYVYAGLLQDGWFYIDDAWYFFDGVVNTQYYGKMLTGEWTRNSQRYVCDSDGKLIRGFVWVDTASGITRYFWAGQYVTGWYDVDGVYWDTSTPDLIGRRYFDPATGNMVTDSAIIDGKTYLFNEDGTTKDGFVNVEGGKVYCLQGEVLSGWQQINGCRYYFNPNNSNLMVSGVNIIDDTTYCFDTNGIFLHEDDHVDENGDGVCDLCYATNASRMEQITQIVVQIVSVFIDILAVFHF